MAPAIPYPDPKFAALDPPTARWLELEQLVNERFYADAGKGLFDLGGRSVQKRLHPGRRGVWQQQAVWLPPSAVRVYGDLPPIVLRNASSESFGEAALLLHTQPSASHRRAALTFGVIPLDGIRVTPTASFRSLLAWQLAGDPFLVKLSLGAKVGGVRRCITEDDVVTAVTISTLLDCIPQRDREHHKFGWFAEPGGVVESGTGEGWLLRNMPAQRGNVLVPVFSLISRRGDRDPLLVEMIRASGSSPAAFVTDRLLRPYVDVLSYLLFVHGISFEGHGQNILVEMSGEGELSGVMVLRDFSDASVSIPMRVALGRPLPRIRVRPAPGASRGLAYFPSDHRCNPGQPAAMRARDVAGRYGLRCFVWSINASLSRYFPRYDSRAVERRYLQLWQNAAERLLGIRPLIHRDGSGLATDEAIALFLNRTDWQDLGASTAQNLPPGCESLRIVPGMRKRRGPQYSRVECAWGDLYLDGDRPAFFRAAF